MFMYSFKSRTPLPEYVDAVRRGEVGAFCLFNYNADSPETVRAFTEPFYQAAREGGQPVPIIGIDQEGGQLMAVTRGATELPGNMALGATRSTVLAEKAGRVLGRELLAMGVNMNYAPSLDINNNPQNPVIGIRAFGASPLLVTELGSAVIRGLQSEGVIATAKHFPGHGDVHGDTHHTAPVVHHNRSHLEAVEFFPFRQAIKAGVQAVMSSHVIYTAIDNEWPATLSRKIMTELLRDEMGFNGLSLTDAMDMYAVSRYGTAGIRQALAAGIDLLILGHIPDQLNLTRSLNHRPSAATYDRVMSARRRLRTDLPPLSVIGSEDHRTIAQEIADAAVTLVRGSLPIQLTPQSKITVITPQPVDLTPADTSSLVKITLYDAVRARHENTRWLELPAHADANTLRDLLNQTDDADRVIVGTIAADQDESQGELVRQLYARGKNPIVVALRTPYDVLAFPMIETYLCVYGIRRPNTEAAARALFGEIAPQGVLPCGIPGIAEEPV